MPTTEIEKGQMPRVIVENADCHKCGKMIIAGRPIEFERFTGHRWHLECAELPGDAPGKGDGEGSEPGQSKEEQEKESEAGKGEPGSGDDMLAKVLRVTVPLIASNSPAPAGVIITPDAFLAEAIRNAVEGKVEESVQKRIDEAFPQIPEVEPLSENGTGPGSGKRKKRLKGMFHKELPMLLKLIGIRNANGHRLNVYMHGPAGGGKSTGAKQASEMNKLEWGYTSLNPQTPDSRILGYMHAGGEYVESEFFRRYTKGGVFCFDEIDNASASLVTTLNSMLENGSGAFPHGVFDRHPDFVCVCTANTIGRGGDVHYPERRPLDGAFLERFVFLEWEHDSKLTKMIVERTFQNDKDRSKSFMDWVSGEGLKLTTRFPQALVTPRAYIQGALLETRGISRLDIYKMVIGRGVKLPNAKK